MGPNRVQQHGMLSLCLIGKSRSCEHVALHNSFAILGPGKDVIEGEGTLGFEASLASMTS